MDIAKYIDHTLLRADATPVQITQLCKEAIQYGFASVCVNPSYVALAAHLLKGSAVKICTVIGFPLGATTPQVKVYEAKCAFADGAMEIDMVISIGRLKGGEHASVSDEIRRLALFAHYSGAILKVIIETALLTDDEKRIVCQMAKDAGADFVKTSTGFAGSGATVADVKLMRATVGPIMGVKASGGINDYATAKAMIDAGATRIGCSSGVAIVSGASKSKKLKQ